MGGLPININNDDSISTGNQSVKKGDLSLHLVSMVKKDTNCKLQPKVLELLITPGPTTTPLILKTRQLLTKALLEPEQH